MELFCYLHFRNYETTVDFYMLILYSLTLLVVSEDFLGFSIYRIMSSTNKCNFTSSFSVWMCFHSRQQWLRVFNPPPPRQHLLLCLSGYGHPSGRDLVSHCGSDLHFPN